MLYLPNNNIFYLNTVGLKANIVYIIKKLKTAQKYTYE